MPLNNNHIGNNPIAKINKALKDLFMVLNNVAGVSMYDRIKCAAVKKDGLIITGLRHCDCFFNLQQAGIDSKGFGQGFVNHRNEFLTREEAAKIAYKHGQIEKPISTLYSEDLY